MTLYRVVDARFPFLWSAGAGLEQPGARWHAAGEGPVQYFADTPAAAWAELLRHEELRDAEDLAGVTAALWAVEPEHPVEAAVPDLPAAKLTGGADSYPACRSEARRLRDLGARWLVAPSAALQAGEGAGWTAAEGVLRRAPARDARVYVCFGVPGGAVGWRAAEGGVPREILGTVRHLGAGRAAQEEGSP